MLPLRGADCAIRVDYPDKRVESRYEGHMTVSGLATRLNPFQQRPLERLRYTVTEANLLRHFESGPQRVLDVAGGHGVEAVRLAALGHEVTVLDPAGAMLSTAIETADALDVADRLHVVQAGALDAPEVFAGHEFDVVLCHNLLQYVDEPGEVLQAVIAPLRDRTGCCPCSARTPTSTPCTPPCGRWTRRGPCGRWRRRHRSATWSRCSRSSASRRSCATACAA